MEDTATNSVGSRGTDAGQRGQVVGRGGYASKIGQAAEDVKRDVKSDVEDMSRTATDAYHQASGYVTEKVDELRRQGKEVMKTAESTIAKQPITSLAVALGVGVIFGLGITSLFRKER